MTSTSTSTTSLPTPEQLLLSSLPKSRAVFNSTANSNSLDSNSIDKDSVRARLSSKITHEYSHAKVLPTALLAQQAAAGGSNQRNDKKRKVDETDGGAGGIERDIIHSLENGNANGQAKANG